MLADTGKYDMFIIEHKAVIGHAPAQCCPFGAQALFIYGAALVAHQYKIAVMYIVLLTMAVTFMLNMTAKNIAVNSRYFM